MRRQNLLMLLTASDHRTDTGHGHIRSILPGTSREASHVSKAYRPPRPNIVLSVSMFILQLDQVIMTILASGSPLIPPYRSQLQANLSSFTIGRPPNLTGLLNAKASHKFMACTVANIARASCELIITGATRKVMTEVPTTHKPDLNLCEFTNLIFSGRPSSN